MNFSQFITHDRDSETYYITITNELISNWKKNCNGLLIISLLTFFLQCLMEIELSMILHTDKYEHNPDRKNSRNGYREKHWETLLGRITLSVPKLRRGNYKPFFSQALQELAAFRKKLAVFSYVCGITVRYVGRLFEKVGIKPMDKSSVSRNTSKFLRQKAKEFNQRDLSGETFPIIYIDALYEDVRIGKTIQKAAVIVVSGVDILGRRYTLSYKVTTRESKDTYLKVLSDLKERGLKEPALIISDAHTGIKNSIKEVFPGSLWQRCVVHLIREALKTVRFKNKLKVYKALRTIYEAQNYDQARKNFLLFKESFSVLEPDAVDKVAKALEDTLTYLSFPEADYRKLYTSNSHERLNRFIRKRTRTSEQFPNKEAYSNLVISWINYFSPVWAGQSYLDEDTMAYIQKIWEERKNQLEMDLGESLLSHPRYPQDMKFVFISSDIIDLSFENLTTHAQLLMALGTNLKAKKQILSYTLLTGLNDEEKIERFFGDIEIALDTKDFLIIQECSHPELEKKIIQRFGKEHIQYNLKSFIPVLLTLIPDNNKITVKENLTEIVKASDYKEAELIINSLIELWRPTLPEASLLLEEMFPYFYRYLDYDDFCRKYYSTLKPLTSFRNRVKELSSDKTTGLNSKIGQLLSDLNIKMGRKIKGLKSRRDFMPKIKRKLKGTTVSRVELRKFPDENICFDNLVVVFEPGIKTQDLPTSYIYNKFSDCLRTSQLNYENRIYT